MRAETTDLGYRKVQLPLITKIRQQYNIDSILGFCYPSGRVSLTHELYHQCLLVGGGRPVKEKKKLPDILCALVCVTYITPSVAGCLFACIKSFHHKGHI